MANADIPVRPGFPDAVVIPVHNRREFTLDCLRMLAADGVFAWATILVVDDGSSDGTAAAVRSAFPAAEIISGDGSWWWCGAIRRGMERAQQRGAARVFWLNDDCRPPAGALGALRDLALRDDAVAWIAAQAPGGWSYGAHRKTAWGIRRCTPDEEARGLAETFSGNCVCLPCAWVERVGLPHDHLFPHGIGDFDYGLRLKAAGAKLRALPGVVAANADPAPANSESWLTSPRTMRDIWRGFQSPRSCLHFPAWRTFALRHWGHGRGWIVFALPYVRWTLIGALRTIAPGIARALGRRRAKSAAFNSPSGRAGSRR